MRLGARMSWRYATLENLHLSRLSRITKSRVFSMDNELAANSNGDIILETKRLKKNFQIREGFIPFSRRGKKYVRAVDDVSIAVPRGKTVAILGESGCGKTTLARAISMLSPPTSGEIIFDGHSLTDGNVDLRKLYKDMQMVFQDPDSSLDPRLKVKDSIAEPCRRLLSVSKREIQKTVIESLNAVGLSAAHAERLPAHLSGGQ